MARSKEVRNFDQLMKMGFVAESTATPNPKQVVKTPYRAPDGSTVEVSVHPKIVFRTGPDGQEKRFLVWQPTPKTMRRIMSNR